MSTIKVDTITTRTGSGNITASNTIAGTSATLSGTLDVTGNLTVDTNTLVVDAANNRIGVGTTSPGQSLQIESTSNAKVRLAYDATRYGEIGRKSNGHYEIASYEDGAPIVFGTITGSSGSTNERMRILAGGGLTFNGDTAAANALDDYEEGTWTPSMGGTTTYYARTGVYTKVGNKVFIRGQVSINQIGTGDTHKILGLPFTSEATTNGNPAGVLGVSYYSGLAIAVTYISGYVESAQSRIQISANATAHSTVQYNTGAFFGNGSRLDFSMTYRV